MENRLYFNTDMNMQRHEKMKVTQVNFVKHAFSLHVDRFGGVFYMDYNPKELPTFWIEDGDYDEWVVLEMKLTMEALKPSWYTQVVRQYQTRVAVEECLAPSSDDDSGDEDSLFSRDSHY